MTMLRWVTNVHDTWYARTAALYTKAWPDQTFTKGEPLPSLLYTTQYLAERGVVGIYAQHKTGEQRGEPSHRTEDT